MFLFSLKKDLKMATVVLFERPRLRKKIQPLPLPPPWYGVKGAEKTRGNW